MKTVNFIILLLMTLFSIPAAGQEEEKQRIFFIEAGMDFISAEPPGKEYIRADVDQYYSDFAATTTRGLLNKNYLGIKYETRILNKKIGLLSGLRYTRMVSSLGKETYWSGSPDFFYLLFSQDETKTEYMKVKEINQVAGYLGIPLELRIYPYKKERKTNVYVYYKIGSDFNFRIHSKTNAVFSNDAMNQYEDAIGNIVEKPWSFYSSVHLGIGFRIGKHEKPGANIEFLFPAAIWGEDKQSLVNPEAGGGVQINVRLPF
jgi:hypothetical protein